ncbi:MAG: DUF3332 domain-containing protein [Opitutae bacterium]|nr:DUF3332 domain-containing protein [Opitutae bacterium]MCD8299291.1 DUF3332 domain-containing protein [Opitutae bacterium]
MKKLAILAGALASLAMFSGCIGDSNNTGDTFACIRTIHKYNTGEITQNKWVNEILFIIPGGICYSIGGFLDCIVFNSIQFWTGKNPLYATTFTHDGVEFLAQKNVDGTVEVTNQATGEKVLLSYDEATKTCVVKEA